MDSNIKVSIILPVYNGEKYLRECLDDILAQSLKEIEVICVNDGSTDATLDIFNEYAKKDERIKVISQENQGAAVGRNNGLELAIGEYVSFLDGDDLFEKNMLKSAYEEAKKQNSDIVIFRGDRYDCIKKQHIQMNYSIKKEQLPQNNPFNYKDIKEHVFTFAVGWAWDKLYKREFVINEGLKFQPLRTSNDLFFVFSSLVKAKSIFILDELLVHHRISVSESLSVTREKSWNCFYEAIKALHYELVKIGVYDELEKGFLNWVVHFMFWNLDTIEGISYKKVYNLIKENVIPEFKMDTKERDYFEHPRYYERMHEIIDMSFDEYIIGNMIHNKKLLEKKTKELVEKNAEIEAIKTSTTFKAGRAVMLIPIKIKKMIKGEN